MRWEDRLDRVLDDLEQQAEGLALSERDAAVAEQRVAEYAGVDLVGRLVTGVGARVRLDVRTVGSLHGVLRRVGRGWLLLDSGGREWVVRTGAVLSVRGLPEGSLPEDARPVTARLGLGSALRGVAESRAEVLVHRVDGTPARGMIGRVGADFVELRGEGAAELVPFGALTAVAAAGS